MEKTVIQKAIEKIDEQIEIAQACRIEAAKIKDETSTSRHHGMKIALVAFRQVLINLLEVEQQQMKKKRITNRERMTNRDILEWADSKGIVEMVNLMEKYEFKNGASLDVDDYRIIYEAESKALLQRNL